MELNLEPVWTAWTLLNFETTDGQVISSKPFIYRLGNQGPNRKQLLLWSTNSELTPGTWAKGSREDQGTAGKHLSFWEVPNTCWRQILSIEELTGGPWIPGGPEAPAIPSAP